MSAHTPAPWSYEYDNSDFSGGGQWFYVYGPEGESLLDYPYGSSPEREATARDNARLIAAAPELLDALRLAYQELSRLPKSLGYDFSPLPKIEAVIAKATGCRMKALLAVLILLTGLRFVFWVFENAEKSAGLRQ